MAFTSTPSFNDARRVRWHKINAAVQNFSGANSAFNPSVNDNVRRSMHKTAWGLGVKLNYNDEERIILKKIYDVTAAMTFVVAGSPPTPPFYGSGCTYSNKDTEAITEEKLLAQLRRFSQVTTLTHAPVATARENPEVVLERKILAQLNSQDGGGGGGNDPLVTAWLARVTSNGGAAPSAGTISAMNIFAAALTSGFPGKFVAVNCFVPDNLIASITPLITPPGVNIWTNHGFADIDLSTEGIQGNGAAYLDTGVNLSAHAPAANNFGISLLTPDGDAQSTIDFGVWNDAGNNQCATYVDYSGSAYFDCWNAAGGRISGATIIDPWNGMTSFNRGVSSQTIFETDSNNTGGTSTAVAQADSGVDGSPPNLNAYCFAAQDASNPGNPVAGTVSNFMFSFAAIHTAFDANQVDTLWNLVYSLRNLLGGGAGT